MCYTTNMDPKTDVRKEMLPVTSQNTTFTWLGYGHILHVRACKGCVLACFWQRCVAGIRFRVQISGVTHRTTEFVLLMYHCTDKRQHDPSRAYF